MFQKLKHVIKLSQAHGAGYLFKRVYSRITNEKIDNYQTISTYFKDKSGLEVGGPSGIFRDRGFIPVYKLITGLDGCNFSATTIWEGDIQGGETYDYDARKKKGVQYILEAVDLKPIPDAKYDFVISSNCLEHVANPIKALKEWTRVLKKGGVLLLILPNKDYCFDHNRPVTTLAHVVDDYNKNIGEDDLTHVDEVLALHDLSMDLPAGNKEQFKARLMDNYRNRAMHHHVFDVALLKEIFNYMGLEVLQTHQNREHIIFGRKK